MPIFETTDVRGPAMGRRAVVARAGRRGRLSLLACLLATASAVPCARAAEPEATTGQTGQTEYEAGITAYNLAHFDEAAGHFENAYKVDHAPILLFNIAQCHRKGGDPERAIFFYRRYLDEEPGTPKRAEVEGRIADLRARLAATQEKEERTAAASPVTAPPAAPAVGAPIHTDAPAAVVPAAPAAAAMPAATATAPSSAPGPARATVPSVPAAPSSADSSRPSRVLPWATLATSTLALAFGVYEATRWAGTANDFNGLRDPATNKALCGAADAGHGADPRCASLYGDMTTARALSLTGLGAGVALGVASAILFHRSAGQPPRLAATGPAGFAAAELLLSCGPSGGRLGLACAARF